MPAATRARKPPITLSEKPAPGTPRWKQGRAITLAPHLWEEIMQRVESGESPALLAQEWGVTPKSIHRRMDRRRERQRKAALSVTQAATRADEEPTSPQEPGETEAEGGTGETGEEEGGDEEDEGECNEEANEGGGQLQGTDDKGRGGAGGGILDQSDRQLGLLVTPGEQQAAARWAFDRAFRALRGASNKAWQAKSLSDIQKLWDLIRSAGRMDEAQESRPLININVLARPLKPAPGSQAETDFTLGRLSAVMEAETVSDEAATLMESSIGETITRPSLNNPAPDAILSPAQEPAGREKLSFLPGRVGIQP